MRLHVCRCKNTGTLPTHALINVVVCHEPLIRQAGGFRITLNETFRANEGFFVTNFSSRDMKGEGVWNESFNTVSRYIRRKTLYRVKYRTNRRDEAEKENAKMLKFRPNVRGF